MNFYLLNSLPRGNLVDGLPRATSSRSTLTCVLSGASFVRVCSFFDMQRLLLFIWRNAAASAVHLEKLMRSRGIRDTAFIRIDAVPRAVTWLTV